MIKRLQTIKNILTNNITSSSDSKCCPISGKAYNMAMEQLTHIIEELQLKEEIDAQKEAVWEIVQAAPPIFYSLVEWCEKIPTIDAATLELIFNDFVQTRKMIKYCCGNDTRYGKIYIYPNPYGGCAYI